MKDNSRQPDRLVDEVANFIDAGGLIAPGGRVVAGVSGGCDSTALLAILRELSLRPERRYELTVAHLDHALRTESPQDAAFAAELAERWDLPCLVERVDVAALAGERSVGLEAAGRTARYDFFQRTAARIGAKYVAVAHHADDNAETICHRIFRGSHLRGAAGMRAIRAMGQSGAMLVRPLLSARRGEIEAFCKRMGLKWRTDPTNAQSDFTRNFIRNELLPTVKKRINPDGDMALVRLGRAIGDAEDFIAQQARSAAAGCLNAAPSGEIVIDAEALSEVHRVLRGWIFREAMEHAGVAAGNISSDKLAELSAMLDNELQTVNLPDDHVARRGERTITIAPAAPTAAPPEAPITLPECGEVTLPSGARIVTARIDFNADTFAAHCAGHDPGVELLDADKVAGQLVCRPRIAGDRFAPLGLNGRQSVSDFLTNSALAPEARDAVRCISDDAGIVYLAPLRIDQRVKITAASSRLIRIQFNTPPQWT